MRTSIGIALAALIGIVACSADGSLTTAAQSGANGTSADEDGTEPSTPGSASSDPSAAETPAGPLVTGLAITDVAFFQAVKVPVVTNGEWVRSRNAPVVAGRPAVVRVYVKPQAGWAGKKVTAELRLSDGAKKYPAVTDTKTITKASTDADMTSTFNLEVPGDSLTRGVSIQVALTAPDGARPSGPSDARFPHDGTTKPLGAEGAGKLKIVVVPVKYMADGSGRTPDVGAPQLALYKQAMMARYPASDVEVTARAPWSYASSISGSGSGFSQVLDAVTQLRRQDGVDDDVYYYGALAPASSFNSYCSSGCVTGLSTVVDDASTAFLRASVGVAFSGGDSAETMAHEVGHAHGRDHAPCGGARGVDPQFPYAGGGIGVWGYDLFAKELHSPGTGTDMMGYCDDAWISDYTYGALFDRIREVNQLAGATMKVANAGASQTYRLATVDEAGDVTWTDAISLDHEPAGGQARDVAYLSSAGTTVGAHTARFYPYDHLPGGVLVVPESPIGAGSAATWSSVRVRGLSRVLSR